MLLFFYHKILNFIKSFPESPLDPVWKFLVDDKIVGGDREEKRKAKWQDKFHSDICCMGTGVWSVLFSVQSLHPEQHCLLNE